MFIAATSVIAKTVEIIQFPSIDQWLNKMSCRDESWKYYAK